MHNMGQNDPSGATHVYHSKHFLNSFLVFLDFCQEFISIHALKRTFHLFKAVVFNLLSSEALHQRVKQLTAPWQSGSSAMNVFSPPKKRFLYANVVRNSPSNILEHGNWHPGWEPLIWSHLKNVTVSNFPLF